MDASATVQKLLDESGLTKAELSRRSGVSRSLLDAYLKGTSQPSVGQIERLGDAAGLRVDFFWEPPAPKVAEALVLVVDMAHYMPRGEKRPLVNLGPIWRSCWDGRPVAARA